MKFQKLRVERGRKPIGWGRRGRLLSELPLEREREGGPTEKLEELFESEIERDAPAPLRAKERNARGEAEGERKGGRGAKTAGKLFQS